MNNIYNLFSTVYSVIRFKKKKKKIKLRIKKIKHTKLPTERCALPLRMSQIRTDEFLISQI